MKKTCGGCANYNRDARRCIKTKARTSSLRKACKGWTSTEQEVQP